MLYWFTIQLSPFDSALRCEYSIQNVESFHIYVLCIFMLRSESLTFWCSDVRMQLCSISVFCMKHTQKNSSCQKRKASVCGRQVAVFSRKCLFDTCVSIWEFMTFVLPYNCRLLGQPHNLTCFCSLTLLPYCN